MNRNFVILILFAIVSCSHYYIGDSIKEPSQISKLDREISYELVGWEGEDNRYHAALLLKGLNESKGFSKIKSHVRNDDAIRVQIILENSPKFSLLFGEHSEPVSWMVERKPGEFSIYILNRVLSLQTLYIFPIFQKLDHKLLFKVWLKNERIGEYSYSLTTLEVFGWISLAGRWVDDRATIEKMYSIVSKKFIMDLAVDLK